MFEKRTLNIYSVIVGIFFLISGIGKVFSTAAFSDLIFQYGLGYMMILSPLIVVIEILLGLFLILLIKPRRYSFLSFILLVIFTAAYAYAHFRNGVDDCGCFGSMQPSGIPVIFSFIRNILLLIMSFIVWFKYPEEKIITPLWKRYVILAVICPSIFIAGYTFSMPFLSKGDSQTHKFQNQNIRNTELWKYVKTVPDRTYLIFCFSYTCPHCWNSIENLRQYKIRNTVDSIITFATGKYSDKLYFIQNFHPDFYIKDISLKAISELTDAVPTAFYIEHDTIKVIIRSVLPSPVTFSKQLQIPMHK